MISQVVIAVRAGGRCNGTSSSGIAVYSREASSETYRWLMDFNQELEYISSMCVQTEALVSALRHGPANMNRVS